MLLRFIGQDEDYGLKHNLVYCCKVYSKKDYIWVEVKIDNYFKLPNKRFHIPYATIERMYSEWRTYGEHYDK